MDTKLRVDIEVKGGAGIINGVEYKARIYDGGILGYVKGKKFKETFREYRYSGKEVFVNEEGIIDDVNATNSDGSLKYDPSQTQYEETLELVKGNTKIEITYQEIETQASKQEE